MDPLLTELGVFKEDLTPYCSLHHFVLYPTANPLHDPNPQCTVATT